MLVREVSSECLKRLRARRLKIRGPSLESKRNNFKKRASKDDVVYKAVSGKDCGHETARVWFESSMVSIRKKMIFMEVLGPNSSLSSKDFQVQTNRELAWWRKKGMMAYIPIDLKARN